MATKMGVHVRGIRSLSAMFFVRVAKLPFCLSIYCTPWRWFNFVLAGVFFSYGFGPLIGAVFLLSGHDKGLRHDSCSDCFCMVEQTLTQASSYNFNLGSNLKMVDCGSLR